MRETVSHGPGDGHASRRAAGPAVCAVTLVAGVLWALLDAQPGTAAAWRARALAALAPIEGGCPWPACRRRSR